MIEKVARALWDYNECGESGLQWDNYEKGTMSDLQKQIHIDMAKAAIEAMRDINDDLMAVLEYDGYSAMIDAALKEE